MHNGHFYTLYINKNVCIEKFSVDLVVQELPCVHSIPSSIHIVKIFELDIFRAEVNFRCKTS